VRAAAAAAEQLERSIGAALDLERKAATMAVWEPLPPAAPPNCPRPAGKCTPPTRSANWTVDLVVDGVG
jgi:hypothetical protein